MKHLFIRLLGMLTVLMLCLLVSMQAWGATLVKNIFYNFSKTDAEVTSGEFKCPGKVVIPSTVKYNGKK